jgi:hypothetical protein
MSRTGMRLKRLLMVSGGPVVAAVALSVLSTPLVAQSLLIEPKPWQVEYAPWRSPGFGGALVLGLGAAIASALAGGSAGGWVRRRRGAIAGTLAAICVGWSVGIAVLPVLAGLLGIPLAIVWFCFDVCTTLINDASPLSGVGTAAQLLISGVLLLVPAWVASVAWVLARRLARRNHELLAATLIVVGFAGLNAVGLLYAGQLAFAALAVGVTAWSWWLLVRDRWLLGEQPTAERSPSEPTPAVFGRGPGVPSGGRRSVVATASARSPAVSRRGVFVGAIVALSASLVELAVALAGVSGVLSKTAPTYYFALTAMGVIQYLLAPLGIAIIGRSARVHGLIGWAELIAVALPILLVAWLVGAILRGL